MSMNTYNYLKKHDEYLLIRFVDLASLDSLFHLPKANRHLFNEIRDEVEEILATDAPDKYDEELFELLELQLEILEGDYELIAMKRR